MIHANVPWITIMIKQSTTCIFNEIYCRWGRLGAWLMMTLSNGNIFRVTSPHRDVTWASSSPIPGWQQWKHPSWTILRGTLRRLLHKGQMTRNAFPKRHAIGWVGGWVDLVVKSCQMGISRWKPLFRDYHERWRSFESTIMLIVIVLWCATKYTPYNPTVTGGYLLQRSNNAELLFILSRSEWVVDQSHLSMIWNTVTLSETYIYESCQPLIYNSCHWIIHEWACRYCQYFKCEFWCS